MKFTAKEKKLARRMFDDLYLILCEETQLNFQDLENSEESTILQWHLVARWHLNELKKLKGK